MRWEEENGKVWRRGQEIDILKISQVDLCLWKESKWENANKEVVELCNRDKEEVCAKKEEGITIIKRKERRDARVH